MLILNCDRLSYSADLYSLILYVSFILGKYNEKEKNKKNLKQSLPVLYIFYLV